MTSPRRRLPVLAPIRPLELAWFDLRRTTPLALAVLRDELGAHDARRVAAAIVRRGLVADPTRALPAPRGRDERLTRMQLRSVVLLDAALREDLGLPPERARGVVRAVMRASGAAFLLHFFGGFALADWDAAEEEERTDFASGLAARIFNAEVGDARADAESLTFDVVRCRFVESLATLGRTELAPLFCEVDAALVERDDVPMSLDRPSTIASGDARCRFRFTRRP